MNNERYEIVSKAPWGKGRCVRHAPDHRASQRQPAIAQGHQQNTEEQPVPQQAPQLVSKNLMQGLSPPLSDGRHPKTPDRSDRDIPGSVPGQRDRSKSRP